MKPKKHDIPSILVIFGATGDLMKKKIIPSVYHLYTHHKLPRMFRVVGMARREMSDEDFRATLHATLAQVPGASKKTIARVVKLFHYSRGDFGDAASFERLKTALENIDAGWKLCSNKLFYLAVAPEHFADIFRHMAAVGLHRPCGGALGWTRMLIEKPFGENYPGSKKLFVLFKKYFREEQLYLIDHYLAKEIAQAILHFRFSNNLFARSWGNKTIERVEVRLLETIGVEDRGAFYDAVGALRDVGQNHLLQLLAAITLEAPRDLSASQLRDRRAGIIEMMKPWRTHEIKKNTFRAQYRGYPAIDGVAKHSRTETYFKLETELMHPEWRGVPIILEAGKRCPEAKKEIVITFKHPPLCIACAPGRHLHNRVVFSFAPEDRISIHFWTKKPGFDTELEERTFDFFLYKRTTAAPYVEEYAKIIYTCLLGNQEGFVSEREALAEWRFADPLIAAWRRNAVPLKLYRPDTDEVIKAAAVIGVRREPKEMVKEIAIVGLGKMGANLARRLLDQGWRVVGYNDTPDVTKELSKEGIVPAYSLDECVNKLPRRKIVWLMVPALVPPSPGASGGRDKVTAGLPAGKPVDEVLFGDQGLTRFLKRGDVVIDGGNSFYKDTTLRAKKLDKLGIKFLDAGTSGGPLGARRGACLMIGGKKKDFADIEPLFRDMAGEDAYQFFAGHGAGHFVKMVHNGIEYGMMQAIAEGFALMKAAPFNLDLTRVADVYNHGSVIESRLVSWLKDAFDMYGEDLGPISGSVQQLGEGAWTAKTAKTMKVKAKIIEEAVRFRHHSEKHPDYSGQILSAMRGQFGGHPVLKDYREDAPPPKPKEKKRGMLSPSHSNK